MRSAKIGEGAFSVTPGLAPGGLGLQIGVPGTGVEIGKSPKVLRRGRTGSCFKEAPDTFKFLGFVRSFVWAKF